jgi:hypothetical protein
MSSRVVKWLLLASLLVVAFPVVAVASPARVDGLGIQGDYIKDYTNVYTYLSNLCCIGNLVYGELGNWDSDSQTQDRAVGAFISNLWDGRYGTFGIHLREEMGALGQADANTRVDADWAWDSNENGSHSFDIMWGKKFGAMSLGLRLNRAYAKYESSDALSESEYDWSELTGDYWYTSDPYSLNWHRNVLGFAGGIGYECSPTLALELGGTFQSRTYEVKDTTGVKFENDGGSAYLLAARALWQWQPNITVVPVFRYFNMNSDLKISDPNYDPPVKFDPYEINRSGWQLGLAGNWALNQNDLFVMGATFGATNYSYKYNYFSTSEEDYGTYSVYDYEYNDTYMPILFAALETHVNPWLTLRFGAQQGSFYTEKYSQDDTDALPNSNGEEKDHHSWYSMNMGAGVKLGTLQLDATLNQSFFHNGPYLISGESTSYLFPKVSATYTF